jgi:aspartyl-tRNA synthetase
MRGHRLLAAPDSDACNTCLIAARLERVSMHPYRSHTCGALSREQVGENVRLSGWVHRKRDHGGVLFVDLRDHYGITQIVADSDSPALALLEATRVESVVTIEGVVKARNDATVNANLATGAIEVFAKAATVISAAEELPMPVAGEQEYPEDIRLRYRFLDLRRETLHANIVTRTKIISDMRRRMEGAGFTEYSTPILTASSPEGARDFLVPSRIHAGKFYALPQAPQQYKQLLMVAGFDRYFQIAPCFRDEDPRADRLPGEFYQLDLEMSFVTQEEVWETMEPVIGGVFEAFAQGKPVTPVGQFPRIAYDEAMLKYGSDKPDLRNPLIISDVSHHFTASGFGLFEKIVGSGGVVRAIPAPNTAEKSRKFFDEMNDWARAEGHAGLGYVTRKGGEFGGPIAKNHGAEGMEKLYAELGLGENDGLFFAAGKVEQAAKLAGAAHARGQPLGPDRRRSLRPVLDRRLPVLRMGRRRQEGRIQPQPVLDAAGRDGGADRSGPADDQGLSVRPRMQRLRDRLGLDPQPVARNHGQGLRDRRPDQGRRGRALWRSLSRVPVWRAAPRRHGCGCRPHRDAAVRRAEPA